MKPLLTVGNQKERKFYLPESETTDGQGAPSRNRHKEALVGLSFDKANKVEPRKDIFVLKRNRLRAFFVSVLFPTLVVT